ncbi:MAG TPA: hypothetical protein PLY99_18785, partial [Acidovorax temperans]|nr:hypothetical protein [Acidovorax temperans]
YPVGPTAGHHICYPHASVWCLATLLRVDFPACASYGFGNACLYKQVLCSFSRRCALAPTFVRKELRAQLRGFDGGMLITASHPQVLL